MNNLLWSKGLFLRLYGYRVVFSVSDITGIAGFVGFDKEIAKVTHVLASEAAQIVEGAADPEAAVHQTVVPGSDSIDARSSNVAEQATTSDGRLAGLQAAAEGLDQESAPKKACVE
ncbi:Uncharacterized protein Rs2_44686 [Raphanus sativus]|uniref:Uncharacterized protein LOC130501093 n=1 Tax=Raphanus sativus TaxID=3726 RepID=A0A9W3CKH8_RAPSA|nr:uncharacterized protein LOC130501093 [Raphanus sativus]KAJ4873618.1 Uncharacterized protein Rs2_44686 [Raphanus sativus]